MKPAAYYMKKAIAQAQKSLAAGEVPVGCVIVDQDGIIVGRGYNLMEARATQQAHAEMRAMAQVSRKRGGWRLDGCTVYVTLEPCMMCMGALLLSRVKKIVYGADSPLFGASNSLNYLPTAYTTHSLLASGLQKEACGALLKTFFSNIRHAKKDTT